MAAAAGLQSARGNRAASPLVPPMDMPKPGPQHALLHRMAGEWEGDETLSPSPWGPGGAARGHGIYRIVTDGMAVTQDYEEHKDGAIAFRGHGVFTIDPSTQDVLWWWFDSMAYPPDGPARGRWEGDTLTLHKSAPQGDARYIYRLQGERYEFSIENKYPGQADYCLFMRGTYTRRG
jgi:hypothetical protein